MCVNHFEKKIYTDIYIYIGIDISVTIRQYNNFDRDNAPIDKEISIRKVRQNFDNGFNVPYLIKHEHLYR